MPQKPKRAEPGFCKHYYPRHTSPPRRKAQMELPRRPGPHQRSNSRRLLVYLFDIAENKRCIYTTAIEGAY